LIILDELGAGTDPQEGAALARAILTHVLERGITTLVTTHHPELKLFAHATPGVVNASVEFDLETLRPTYHLTVGLPGRSNALAIAQRLGMPAEIITAARSEISPDDLRAEDLLDEIHRQRDLSRQARAAADIALHEAESLRTELAQRLEAIDDERRKVIELTRAQAEAELRDVQEELRQTRRALARARQPVEALQVVEEQIEKVETRLENPVERKIPDVVLPQRRAMRLGDKVRVRSLNAQGVLTALGEEEVEVQVGMLRIRTRLAEVEPLGGSPIAEHASSEPVQPSRPAGGDLAPAPAMTYQPVSPGMEIDLRGQRADEALAALERYLDSAYLTGLPFVRIIHGKGTGRLREVVRQVLQGHPHVRAFEAGSDKEGGDGVTVAKLAQ